MTRFCTQKTLPFSQEQLFALVSDIEAYPQFIKGCQKIQILSRTEQSCVASVCAGMGPFQGTYQCEVTFHPHEHIRVRYLQGPFQHLHNEWSFAPLPNDHTQVSFAIDFAFSSPLYQMTMEIVFDNIVNNVIESFEQEAKRRMKKEKGNV